MYPFCGFRSCWPNPFSSKLLFSWASWYEISLVSDLTLWVLLLILLQNSPPPLSHPLGFRPQLAPFSFCSLLKWLYFYPWIQPMYWQLTPKSIIPKASSSDHQTHLCNCLRDMSTLNVSNINAPFLSLQSRFSCIVLYVPITHQWPMWDARVIHDSCPNSHSVVCKVLIHSGHYDFPALSPSASILNLSSRHIELLAVPQTLFILSYFRSLCSSRLFCVECLNPFSIRLNPTNLKT